MSIATHHARFDPQLAFDLAPDEPAAREHPFTCPHEAPTHAGLVAAALANECVRTFIGERVPTWSAERVERDPPCFLVYEHGEVLGSVRELAGLIRHAEKCGGLGRRLGIRALQPDEEVLKYNIGLRRAPSHPRRFRYEQRMALKRRLAPGDRRAVGWAMRNTRREFKEKATAEPGLAARIADTTGLSLEAFWRAARGRGEHAATAPDDPRRDEAPATSSTSRTLRQARPTEHSCLRTARPMPPMERSSARIARFPLASLGCPVPLRLSPYSAPSP
jgi:hypothetical protein